MNKVLRIISIVLLGAAAAAMFLMYTPITDDSAVITYALYKDEIKLIIPALLFVSGILCMKVFGFKNKKAFRIVIALLAAGVGVLSLLLPDKVTTKGDIEIHAKFVFMALGYVIVFLLLFILHLVELGSRKGVSKIVSPFADIAMMAIDI